MPSPTAPADSQAAGSSGEAVSPYGIPAFSPLYQQIKGLILQSLQSGEWKPGEVIPSENDLASRYKVSQGTVRKAIDELAAEHLLVRRQGKGTFVATHSEQQVQYRFLRLMPDPGHEELPTRAARQIIDCKRTRAPADLARLMGLRAGDALIQVRRVLSFDDVPAILEDIWLPGSPFKGLTLERLQDWRGPMYAMFESEFGVRLVRAQEQIKAVLPDAAQAGLLGLDTPVPLLSVERVAYTYNDAPVEVRRGLYRTDRHHYFNTLN
jgi:GntR family transcriptional regulator